VQPEPDERKLPAVVPLDANVGAEHDGDVDRG